MPAINDNRIDIGQIFNTSFRTHDQRFLALGQSARAIVAVIFFKGLGQLIDADVAGRHARIVGHDLKTPDQAAQRIDVGQAPFSAPA